MDQERDETTEAEPAASSRTPVVAADAVLLAIASSRPRSVYHVPGVGERHMRRLLDEADRA